MPGRKRKMTGMARITQRGMRGPSIDALKKVLPKKRKRALLQSYQKFPDSARKRLEFASKKRWRLENRIAAGKALSALGFDARKPEDRKARAAVHRVIQIYSDLKFDAHLHPEQHLRMDAEHHPLMQSALQTAAALVGEAKAAHAKGTEAEKKAAGEKAASVFLSQFRHQQSRIDAAYQELRAEKKQD